MAIDPAQIAAMSGGAQVTAPDMGTAQVPAAAQLAKSRGKAKRYSKKAVVK